ncbi:MAG: histidinol dehydrogenase, partial [Candidatus Omnitrophica bacterium]|nr:histidinol dehydrogenase [Candidatus Omnitrophota bacterium]
MKVLKQSGEGIEKLYNRHAYARRAHVEEKVRKIIDDVRLNGDNAVAKYTRKFDKTKLPVKNLRVPESEISGAFQCITSDFVNHLKFIINNVSGYYRQQLKKPGRIKSHDGVL